MTRLRRRKRNTKLEKSHVYVLCRDNRTRDSLEKYVNREVLEHITIKKIPVFLNFRVLLFLTDGNLLKNPQIDQEFIYAGKLPYLFAKTEKPFRLDGPGRTLVEVSIFFF